MLKLQILPWALHFAYPLQNWVRRVYYRFPTCAVCRSFTVVNPVCREYWPPTEDGGGATSAERKAHRPVQLQPNRPA